MKQIHKLKQMNKKLEIALLKIDKIAEAQKHKQIQQIIEEALDKKGNTK